VAIEASETRRGLYDRLRDPVEPREKAVAVAGHRQEEDLVDTRVAVAARGVEVDWLHVGRDADLELAALAAGPLEVAVEARKVVVAGSFEV
jgi:hypothetical protein